MQLPKPEAKVLRGPMNFISREDVLAIIDEMDDPSHIALRAKIAGLFSFPAPNPDWRSGNERNVMGQTEEEFWAKVDASAG